MESVDTQFKILQEETKRLGLITGVISPVDNKIHEVSADQWPVIANEAFNGLAGDIVRILEPHTEADPIALLVSILGEYGCIIRRQPHLILDGSYHPLLIYPVIVGKTSKARKGVSAKRIKKIFETVDPSWTRGIYKGTLSSGEGLAFAVRDPVFELKTNKKGETEEVLTDEGVTDKRLFLVQSEWGAVLKLLSREGNSLSGTIRDAWDGETLCPMTKSNRVKATNPHIAILGHVTIEELKRNLNQTETANGFGNRFAYFLVQRSKELPFSSEPKDLDLNPLIYRLRESVKFAEGVDQIELTESAKEIWRKVYGPLSGDKGGVMAGLLLARSEAYVMRVSAIYALMDQKRKIDDNHLTAALALWQYSEESVFYIFGRATGDQIADRIREFLKKGPRTKTEINDFFKGHVSSDRIDKAIDLLKEMDQVNESVEDTPGRRVTKYFLKC